MSLPLLDFMPTLADELKRLLLEEDEKPSEGMLILDVVDGKITCVEVLFRDEIRKALHQALP